MSHGFAGYDGRWMFIWLFQINKLDKSGINLHYVNLL